MLLNAFRMSRPEHCTASRRAAQWCLGRSHGSPRHLTASGGTHDQFLAPHCGFRPGLGLRLPALYCRRRPCTAGNGLRIRKPQGAAPQHRRRTESRRPVPAGFFAGRAGKEVACGAPAQLGRSCRYERVLLSSRPRVCGARRTQGNHRYLQDDDRKVSEHWRKAHPRLRRHGACADEGRQCQWHDPDAGSRPRDDFKGKRQPTVAGDSPANRNSCLPVNRRGGSGSGAVHGSARSTP